MCPDGGLLMLGSSVYRKRGFMYRQFREYHGNPNTPADTLVWFAPSSVMNPRLPTHVVDRALAENAPKAGAEFNNLWREDLADFIPADVVDSAVDLNIYERAPTPDSITGSGIEYVAYADAAGGTGQDSFAFAIAHRSASITLDLIREYRPRFVPAQVIAELAQLAHAYGITEVQGDRYAIGFHEAEWRTHGINFVPCEHTTSENYLALLPLLLANRVRLVNNTTLRSQLASLERRVGAADRESEAA